MGADFQPQYIAVNELPVYQLPEPADQANIIQLIQGASSLIDEWCGRIETDGNGSLAYTTYTERIHLPEGRNIARLSYKPLVAVSTQTYASLSGKGAQFDNELTPNETYDKEGVLSPLVSARGRYGYGRRGENQHYPAQVLSPNLMVIANQFGGPPGWLDIDVASIDYDARTGEVWIPSGLYIVQYTEIEVKYNSGFNPTKMPAPIKHACAAIVRNQLAQGGGTTGLKSLSGAGKTSIVFGEHLIDPTVQTWLEPYKTVMAL